MIVELLSHFLSYSWEQRLIIVTDKSSFLLGLDERDRNSHLWELLRDFAKYLSRTTFILEFRR